MGLLATHSAVGRKNIVQKLPSQIEVEPTPEYVEYKKKSREDACWVDHPDVDYADLDHFLNNCRRRKDKESFDTAIRILQAIKEQVLKQKNDKNKKSA